MEAWTTTCGPIPAGFLTHTHVAVGQIPYPSEHPNPTTKMGSKMGASTYLPKWDPKTVLTTTGICNSRRHSS